MSKLEAGRTKTGGRQKGTPNKTTALLKDAILRAAEAAGDGDMDAYLEKQARENPAPFMALLGKVLPMQVAHSGSIDTSSKEQRDAAVAAAARANR